MTHFDRLTQLTLQICGPIPYFTTQLEPLRISVHPRLTIAEIGLATSFLSFPSISFWESGIS